MKATELEITTVLMLMEEREMRVVQALIEQQARIELDELLVPNLSSEGAHYNRGRVAALESMADSFEQAWRHLQKAP